jgi:APA family basic amino acid/polyamine antiporter
MNSGLSGTDRAPAQDPPGLRRVLGTVQVTAAGVGIIIGAGIYVLLGDATQRAGSAVWLSFLIAAVLCGLTGLSYCELASMYPSAGAEYEYSRRAFGPRIAFVTGWTMVAALVVAAAAVAIGFAHYLQYFASIPIRVGAIALLALEALVALSGITRSARLTLVLSAVQVAGLVAIVVIGAPHIGRVDLLSGVSARGVFGGAALVFFAFIGFDEVITLAEETHNPTRTIPRALLFALGISTVLYMAVAVAAVSVVGSSTLAGSTRPLADVMAHVLGGRAESTVAAVALASTTNTALLALTAASRLLYGMSHSGAMPVRLDVVSRRTQVPHVAIAVAAVAAIAFASAGDLTLIASVTDFAVYIVFLAVNAAVIVLRVRRPQEPRPFRIPGAIGRIPVVPAAGFLAAAAMVPQLDGPAIAIGSGVVAAGLLAALVLPARVASR